MVYYLVYSQEDELVLWVVYYMEYSQEDELVLGVVYYLVNCKVGELVMGLVSNLLLGRTLPREVVHQEVWMGMKE